MFIEVLTIVFFNSNCWPEFCQNLAEWHSACEKKSESSFFAAEVTKAAAVHAAFGSRERVAALAELLALGNVYVPAPPRPSGRGMYVKIKNKIE